MATSRSAKIEVENVIRPGSVKLVDARLYTAMRRAFLKTLPRAAPGLTEAEISAGLPAHLPRQLFAGGYRAGWWQKTVQLDLEAKGLVARAKTRPLRWHRT